MIDRDGLSINSPELTKLKVGTLDVGVPLLDNVVQLHNLSIDARTRLAIDIEPAMVVMKRIDDEPLQIQRYVKSQDLSNLFEAPIEDLVLIRGREKDSWTATGENVSIVDEDGFKDFIDTLTGFALAKQVDRKSSHRVAKHIYKRIGHFLSKVRQ